MYRSIVISGQIASGTSTAAKNVAQKLNLKYESAGDFFRKYALEHNIPLYDKAQIPDNVDQEADAKLAELAKSGGWVIDAHYLGYFTKDNPEVLKVLLKCEDKERFKRALARHHTHAETVEEIKKREVGLDAKFKKLYSNEDYLDPKFFNLQIDTTNKPEEEVLKQIVDKFNS
ncbi:MAG: cytidylate kinase family protein [Patescibacteria group bacterium]